MLTAKLITFVNKKSDGAKRFIQCGAEEGVDP